MTLLMMCDREGCEKSRVSRPTDIPQGGAWIIVSGAVDLHFCSLPCALEYVRKQVNHE